MAKGQRAPPGWLVEQVDIPIWKCGDGEAGVTGGACLTLVTPISRGSKVAVCWGRSQAPGGIPGTQLRRSGQSLG